MQLDEIQQKIVDQPNEDLIVSAGAGSGKTAVLTKRIIKLIEDRIQNEVNPLKKFLVITFTDAAAKEMKERVKKALNEKNSLKYLVPYVDSSHIQTYDSFRLYVLKKYGSVIGINSSISNVSEAIIKVKIYNYIDEILDEGYKAKDQILADLFNVYYGKSDRGIKNATYEIYLLLDEQKDIERYIEKYPENYLTREFYEKFFTGRFNQCFELLTQIKKILLNSPFNEKEFDKFNASFGNFINERYESYNDFRNNVSLIEKSDIRSYKSDESKKAFLDIKEKINKIKELVKSYEHDKFFNIDLPNYQKYIPFLLNLGKKVHEKIWKFKVENSVFEFKDVEKLSNELVMNYKDVAEKLKNEFDIIMIDEYQDTNDKQAEFIASFANNNVFMVGDIKQSIYGFRDSNPKLFVEKYNYLKSKTNKDECHCIDMNTNYRSRNEVTDYINILFTNLMVPSFGGIDYKASHIINNGNKALKNNKKEGYSYGFRYIKANKIDNNSIEKEEYEARLIAIDIQNKIINKHQIYDLKLERFRDCCYSDFALLSSKKTNFDAYEKVFGEYSIPVISLKETEITKDMTLLILKSILTFIDLINNPVSDENYENNLKHAYISIARSFLYEYSDEKILDLIENCAYKNDELFKKLYDFAAKNKNTVLKELILNIVEEFKFALNLSKVGDPSIFLDTLSVIFNYIDSMNNLNYDIHDFIEFLNEIDDSNIKIESKISSTVEDAVTIQSIHGSKGLQYRIIYFINLNDEFLKSNNKGKASYDFCNKKYGFALYQFSSDKATHFIQREYYKEDIEQEEIYEKLRVFYVALTRTVDEGYFIVPLDAKDECLNLDDAKKYYDFLSFGDHDKNFIEYDLAIKPINNLKILKDTGKPLYFKENITKYSLKTLTHASKENNSQDLNDINKLKYGTHMHLLMELLDFKTKDTSYIKSSRERKIIDNILQDDLFSNLSNSKIYKEYSFFDEEQNINGIIDLMIIHEDYIDIVDYKLKHIDDAAYDKQLNIYKSYVERVFKMKVKCTLLSLINNEKRVVL